MVYYIIIKDQVFDYYQTCNMKHHRGIMHGLLYYYQRGQVLVIIIKDET